jgi:iron-sulfur cluster assembly protein
VVFLQQNSTLFVFNLNKNIMITVTEAAKSEAIKLMQQENKANAFIRVGVKGGGCSGLMYELEFDTEQREDDKTFEDNGIKVVVDKKSFLYLIGTELDFSGGLNGKGFVFKNPNADRTCGCGESFSV